MANLKTQKDMDQEIQNYKNLNNEIKRNIQTDLLRNYEITKNTIVVKKSMKLL